MWSTSSSHTVNSGKRIRGRRVLFCFFAGLEASVSAVLREDVLLAERSEEDALLAAARSALDDVRSAAEERVDLPEEARVDLPSEERVAETGAGDLPSSYLAAWARDVPAALSAS